jgi:hypothetical protein
VPPIAADEATGAEPGRFGVIRNIGGTPRVAYALSLSEVGIGQPGVAHDATLRPGLEIGVAVDWDRYPSVGVGVSIDMMAAGDAGQLPAV